MSDEADKAAADAQRLLDCDGPHLRKWMNDDPPDFIATVRRVAALAIAPRPEPAHAPLYVTPEEASRSRPVLPPRSKKW